MPEEPPFRPRLRPGAFLRSLRGGPKAGPATSPLVLLALAGTLFSFHRVFLAFGRMRGDGVSAPLADAQSPIQWLVLGAGFAGLTALAMQRRVERKAGLKPGALRELAREAWLRLKAWGKERRKGEGAAEARGAAEGPPAQGR